METKMLDGIMKAAALEVLLPAGYGYYAHTKGGKLSDTAVKGALIGAGVETLGSIGDIMKREVSLKTLTDPIRGGVVGGLSAIGGKTIVPMLVGAARYTNWEKVRGDAAERVREILREMRRGS